ncbi:hypothetical protein VPH35_063824 [Triticum aestivum]|uniref:KIB1-4 beta-propeller domain-containing protein n=1 Tax=Aegilops tauschii TaxID=37682 RepID=N1QPT0_AEGTA
MVFPMPRGGNNRNLASFSHCKKFPIYQAGHGGLVVALVHRITKCLLATNDLDWYMDFHVVCPSWGSATEDPPTPLTPVSVLAIGSLSTRSLRPTHTSWWTPPVAASSARTCLCSAMLKAQHHLKVFRINTGRIVLDPVESIGSRAFFLGRGRYMSVDADNFPSIDANCIYYVKSTDWTHDIYKYDLEGEKEERVSEARHSLNPSTCTLPATIPPFTILKLLSSYTNNIETSQLMRCARTQSVTRSGVKSEYAYEASDPGSCWCLNMIEVVDFQNYPRRPRNGAEVARP